MSRPHDVPERTLRRWLAAYRAGGLAALAHRPRSDSGRQRMPLELQLLIEGLALRRPPPAVATGESSAVHDLVMSHSQYGEPLTLADVRGEP